MVLAVFIVGCARGDDPELREPYIDPGCPPLRGSGTTIRGDLVRTEDAARKIATVILASLYTSDQLRQFSGIAVEDVGRSWRITQAYPTGVYGSGVQFEINKCSAAIEGLKSDV
jgi:hypothetical protein